jgi:TrmH family RNA methyltransferase
VPKQIGAFDVVPGDHILALQGIRDPGNLGTIIRTADWYGFNKIIASPDTVDVYNPKVVSATKGSFVRVHTLYQEIDTFIKEHPHMHVYGTFLRGRSLYDTTITAPSVIILGNESQGIDAALQGRIGHRLTIPRVGGAESLNVGVAAAIICDHIRRQDQQK